MFNTIKKDIEHNQITEKAWIWRLGPSILFVLVWIVTTAFAYRYGETYLDSDMASEMVLANLLNREGSILSTNWFYSSEIRIIGHVLLFRPLLLIFPNNWLMVRTVAESILILLTGLTYIYITSVLEDIRKSIIFATIIICPFGFLYMWQGIFCGFYLLWIIVYGICGGLMLRIVFNKGKCKSFQFVVLAIISLIIGLQSIRGLLNLFLPLLLAAVVLWYIYCRQNNEQQKEDGAKVLSFLKVSFLAVLFSAAGYAGNAVYISRKYTFFDQNDKAWQDFSFSKMLFVLEKFLKLWGYPNIGGSEIPLFSINGLLSCFGLLLILLVVMAIVILVKYFKVMSFKHQIYAVSAITTMIVPYLVFVFFQLESGFNGAYFLPSMAFFIAGLQVALDHFPYKFSFGKRHVIIVLLATVAINSVNTLSLFLKNPPRSNEQMVVIADELKNEGYKQCIATFWNANVVTELTDGTIEAWCMETMTGSSVYQWLQEKSHADSLPTGKCAMIFNREEYDIVGIDLLSQEGYTGIYGDEKLVVIGTDNIDSWWSQIKE